MKAWKIAQVVGVLVLLLGVVFSVGRDSGTGTALLLLGTLTYAVGRIGAWLKSDRA